MSWMRMYWTIINGANSIANGCRTSGDCFVVRDDTYNNSHADSYHKDFGDYNNPTTAHYSTAINRITNSCPNQDTHSGGNILTNNNSVKCTLTDSNNNSIRCTDASTHDHTNHITHHVAISITYHSAYTRPIRDTHSGTDGCSHNGTFNSTH
eukprot:m.165293 g.165293  ORF g.165293 m.165293 type:complete len:152 (+) comp12543_c0_seq1:1138-1593(+)